MGTMKTHYIKEQEQRRNQRRIAAQATEHAAKPKATERQIQYAQALANKLNLDNVELMAIARRFTPIYARPKSLADLTRIEISQLIKGLQNGPFI